MNATEKELKLLDYIYEHGSVPIRTMVKDFKVRSNNAIFKILKSLEKKNLIRRIPNHHCKSCGGIRTIYKPHNGQTTNN